MSMEPRPWQTKHWVGLPRQDGCSAFTCAQTVLKGEGTLHDLLWSPPPLQLPMEPPEASADLQIKKEFEAGFFRFGTE